MSMQLKFSSRNGAILLGIALPSQTLWYVSCVCVCVCVFFVCFTVSVVFFVISSFVFFRVSIHLRSTFVSLLSVSFYVPFVVSHYCAYSLRINIVLLRQSFFFLLFSFVVVSCFYFLAVYVCVSTSSFFLRAFVGFAFFFLFTARLFIVSS